MGKDTPYQRRQKAKKYKSNPDPSYKVSRVRVPRERQDSLFSAMVNWIFRTTFKRQGGGRS